VHGQPFVLGAVALGRSISEHAAVARDRVCMLAGPPLSQEAEGQLRAAGWRLLQVPYVANPIQHHPAKLANVYSKLAVFGLVQYSRIMYFDADTLVVSSIAEQLFSCPARLCAALRHSERWNSGVMSLSPTEGMLQAMLAAAGSTESYTGGDQGFLNALYPLAGAPLWEPGQPDAAGGEMARLSTAMNADWGLFVLSNRWPFPADRLAVQHFTLGPLKPWQWWTPWLAGRRATAQWQAARSQAAPGLLGWSCTPAMQEAAAAAMLACALATAAAAAARARRRLSGRVGGGWPAWLARWAAWGHLLLAAPAACVAAGAAAAGAAAAAVPRRAAPGTGMLLFQAWSCAIFATAFGGWLETMVEAGKERQRGGSTPATTAGAAAAAAGRAWRAWAAMQTGLLLLPLLSLCTSGLLVRVGAAAAAAGVLACAAAAEARDLARLWQAAGAAAAEAEAAGGKQV